MKFLCLHGMGGALAASFLLHHRETHPHDPELFQLASAPQNGAVAARDLTSEDVIEPLRINGFIAPPVPGDVILRLYHPEREATRIEMPTVHIMGSQDPFYPQSLVLAQLCSGHVEVVEHQQGHILPRINASFIQQAVASIEQCIQRASLKC
ncbi:hypothetical protein PG997_006646 [Apiospora hydei]|uniref:Serine hydrolase domain-containing protein n=1 Tax=Apiospora hydei TaxID=1337664 RepID=A0ABR1WP97_9PEZI